MKYNNDAEVRNLKCANCGKVLVISLGHTNKYFCNRYCQNQFTKKAKSERLSVKKKLEKIGYL